jgi:flavin-dependent dehydrogenase
MDPMSTPSPEAVVIGAGPAGALAAHRLATGGVGTLLVDRSPFPRAKLCGGCLAHAGLRALAAAGLDRLPALLDARPVNRLALRSRTRRLDLAIPPYTVIDRAAFDEQLARAAADAGAVFRAGLHATVSPDASVTLTAEDRTTTRLTPRVIIVADGLKGSALRDHPAFSWRIRKRAKVGVGRLIPAAPHACDPDAVTFVAELGVELPAPLPGSADGAPALTRSRGPLELDGRIFLCGDAAGYLEPFTGEGITWALEAGLRAADHARDALAGRDRPGRWTAECRRRRARQRRLCHAVTSLLDAPLLAHSLIALASTAPMAAAAIERAILALQPPAHPPSAVGGT